MNDLEAAFRNRILNVERLLAYGFTGEGGRYVWSTRLMDGLFEMTVTITEEGRAGAEVVDLAADEPYTLFRVAGAGGAFVGRVRAEYDGVLAAIAEACFDSGMFQGGSAQRVIQYIHETYQDHPEFLWGKFPGNAIFRRQDNAKWYAALLRLPAGKLGLPGEDLIDILDLRGDPESLPQLIDGVKYFPGYHMNKKHWFTVVLDGSLPAEDIFARIDASYRIAAKR